MKNTDKKMDTIVALCKGRGFVFSGSEIYGGLANSWDYGPLGVELKNNIKRAWWKKFVQESKYNYGLDSAILMNPTTWKASGHLAGFSDPLLDCKDCKTRHRADTLIENYNTKHKIDMLVEKLSNEEMEVYIQDKNIKCPNCGKSNFTKIRNFNLMFKTFQGVTEDSSNTIYLRPETAQGIFVNFKNIQRSLRAKIPFGVSQIGKSFRNEITPGNFIYRIREFEQLELEFFCKPGTDEEWFDYWLDYSKNFLTSLGIDSNNLTLREHDKEELSHYSKRTVDIEFLFPFGFGELWGIANRTNFDLTSHQNESGKNLEYVDPVTGEKYIPYVVEPSLGADRVTLAFLVEAYTEEKIADNDTRVVLKLHPALAPYKVAILPLQKNLSKKAEEVYAQLAKHFMVTYDESGSIGKRYRRQDEIGTPMCITIDFDTLEDNTVTIRDRDTMQQIRLNINDLKDYIDNKIAF